MCIRDREGNHIILFVETEEESAEDTNTLLVQQQRIVTGKVTDQNGCLLYTSRCV